MIAAIFYRCPGNHQCPGGTFDWIKIENEAHAEELKQAGWCATLDEARGIKQIKTDVPTPPVESEPPVGDNTPPTREELEEQAKALGIKFYKNTTDKKLLDAIDAVLAS